jgi:signal transduction histidine kinase
MRYVSWARIRTGRLLVILVAVVLYILLLVVDGLHFFPRATASPFLDWTRFGFSALIALMYLAVGILVLLFTRDRRVALLLFCFSFTMMLVFTVETATSETNDPQLLAIAGVSGSLTLLLFSVLLLIFPKNYLAPHKQSGTAPGSASRPGSSYYFAFLLKGYVTVLILFSIFNMLYSVFHDLLSLQLPGWLIIIVSTYYLLALLGILTTTIFSYHQASSLRERQQLRLFVIGVILAFAPFLFLTLLPQLFLPPQYQMDSQISTLTAVLLPLALGYSILRYQILVFDSYIRRAVAWITGGVALAVLGYLVVMLGNLIWSGNTTACTIFIAIALLILGPCAWWVSHMITERLFFSEIVHYRRLIEKPELLTRETFDLDEASALLTLAAVNAFETQEVCLFVLDEDTGYYRLSPVLREDNPNDTNRRRLAQQLLHTDKSTSETAQAHQHASPLLHTDWLRAQVPVIENIANAKRPLLLSEASKADTDQPAGLSRFLATTFPADPDPLLAPVRTQGKMIGILVLGQRGDREPYAGPDFEVIDLITSRFSPVLETARLYEQASRHVATLNTLYSASATLEKAYQSIEEVAVAYATVAAGAVMAGAEVWLHDEDDQILRHVIQLGSGPRLTTPERLTSLQARDWTAWFYEGSSPGSWKGPSADVPPCLPQTPQFPFAWIPLTKGQRHHGMLVLTYPRPHLFSQEEKRVLGMFANQCAAAMENAQITIALRAAYERQKELDRLKDQFIMTASHELRTPLTAVQGYIDLLEQYNASLSTEERLSFLAKAQRSSDELVLLVGNIMDASRVETDVEQVSLCTVSLASSVMYIVEILEAIMQRENRHVQVNVPAHIMVVADELRLRQVLLNLVGNAIKYSPAGTSVDISAVTCGEDVTLRVRDFGLGVPAADQERLFERFVRLERDMNSPARGTGLGLYISKRLIEAMGGRIWVESSGTPGKGSIFAFTLKCQKTNQAMNAVEIH